MAANDAFTAGVRPGGLTNSTEIRLLLCYLVKNAGPITRTEIENALMEEALVNYFEIGSCLDDIARQQLVTAEGDRYTITDKGRKVAQELAYDLPRSVREKAVAAVDACVDKVLKKILSMGGGALLTADHGNADKMIAEDGSPFTAHTTNPVPVVLVCDALKNVKLREGGVLADLALTLLDMMGIPVPAEMTGKSLIVR